ncbi:MAG: MMPL family transporter [Cyclobacteriaceae bacterium]|nr:MMPL family transporter [Cyclobacteriaceae bacterium]
MDSLLHNILNQLKELLQGVLSAILFKIHPAFVFSALFLITVFWASFLPSLQFNYDIESFFSSNDPEVRFYYDHRDHFENENDFVLLGIRNNNGIFQKDFLERIDTLSKALKQFPELEKIFSPTGLYETINGPLGSIRIPLVHVHDPDRYASDKNRIYTSGLYTNSFFSPDAQSVSLLIKIQEGLSKQANENLLLVLNKELNSYGFDEFHIAGRIQTQHYYVSHMKKQMALFSGLAFLLFFGSLLIIFKCIRYVLLSLGAVIVSLIWIFGIIGMLSVQLDLMLTLLPALIFIISTSGSIHLITRFRKEYLVDVSKKTAIKKSILKTGLPNFLNSFTTAIGFTSLIMIPVAPVQRFGLFAAIGILIAFFVGILFVPTALKVLQINPTKKNLASQPEKAYGRILQTVLKRSRLVMGIFYLFIIAGIYFSFQVKINNHFLDDLNPSSSLKNDLDFFERRFSGIRPFEVNIQANDGKTILAYNALAEMDLVEKYLKDEYKAGFLFSPLTFVKSINKAIHGGNQDYYRLPDSQQDLDKVIKLAEKQRIWKRFLPVITTDRSVGRITGRTTDDGSLIFKKRKEELNNFLKENTHFLQSRVTGAAHLMDNANSHIAWNLTKGIMLAIAISTFIIGLFTNSWKLALISLIPNLLPLLLVTGFMGIADIPLKVATSLIFTISYGIAVDDTIHFLNDYRINRKIYSDNILAVEQTISRMWQPMLYTSVVLFSGFLMFFLSDFSSIATLGLLVSGTLLMALLADLLLLPVILSYLPEKNKTNRFGR